MPATFDAIASTRLTSTQSTIEISSIPSGFTDLRVVLGRIYSVGGGSTLVMRFNNDSGNNYAWSRLGAGGSTVTPQGTSSATGIDLVNGAEITGVLPSQLTLDIFGYSSTNYSKQTISQVANVRGTAGTVNMQSSFWNNTTTINRITFFNSATGFAAGTTLTIYGILAA